MLDRQDEEMLLYSALKWGCPSTSM